MEHAALVRLRAISAILGCLRTDSAVFSKRSGPVGGRVLACRSAQRPRSRDRSSHRGLLPDSEIAVYAARPDVRRLFSRRAKSRRLLVATDRVFGSSPDGSLRGGIRIADRDRVPIARARRVRATGACAFSSFIPAACPFTTRQRRLSGSAGVPSVLPGNDVALVGVDGRFRAPYNPRAVCAPVAQIGAPGLPSPSKWVLCFGALSAGMFALDAATYPASPHIEWPGVRYRSEWLSTFLWIRDHTPKDALFALDAEYLLKSGVDLHGFRAIAERSMLADQEKDSGAASVFPELAERWKDQSAAQSDWTHVSTHRLQNLRARYGVSWVVLEKFTPMSGLVCPYSNGDLRVCRIVEDH